MVPEGPYLLNVHFDTYKKNLGHQIQPGFTRYRQKQKLLEHPENTKKNTTDTLQTEQQVLFSLMDG